MKKKDLKLIKKKNFDKFKKINKKKKFNKLIKISLKKFNKFSRALSFRIINRFRKNKGRYPSYNMTLQFFNQLKYISWKKEFFFFKKLFFNLKYEYKCNYIVIPVYIFEKQFLFKNMEFNELLTNSNSFSVFFKKSYNLYNGSGFNYLITGDSIMINQDEKDLTFVNKDDLVFFYENLNFFNLELTYNIYYFVLVEVYKILILITLNRLINF